MNKYDRLAQKFANREKIIGTTVSLLKTSILFCSTQNTAFLIRRTWSVVCRCVVSWDCLHFSAHRTANII